MKVWTGKSFALVAGLWVGLTSSIGRADPLHQFGSEGGWRHEYSGWQFTRQVGDFSRVMAPYTIDGNNDVGVRYERGSGLEAVVEIYLADSTAPDAKLEGAKASATKQAGQLAQAQSERAFRIEGHEDVRGTKIAYVANHTKTTLYFFEASRWTVKVLGSGSRDDADRAMDAFVRALPWDSLGDPTAIH